MDYLAALLLGAIIGSIMQFAAQRFFSRNGIREYAKKLIIGTNSALQSELDYIKTKVEDVTKDLTEAKIEAAKLTIKVELLETIVSEKDEEITELKALLETKNKEIIELRSRLKEVERAQNGANKNNKNN